MAIVSRFLYRLAAVGLLAALLIGWEIFSRWIYPAWEPMAAILFPPPSAGVRDAIALLDGGALAFHALASIQRVYIGLLAAAVVAIPLGIVMGLSATVFSQLNPVVNVLRPIPPVAWIPITLLWFGVTDTQQYFIIFIGTIFPMLLNTIAGVHGVDPVLKRAALSLGAGRTDMFMLMMRAALPSIFLGVRTSLGLGWFILVASEMVSASTGLGFLIIEGRTAMITERLYVGMFLIGLIGLVQDHMLVWLKEKLISWD